MSAELILWHGHPMKLEDFFMILDYKMLNLISGIHAPLLARQKSRRSGLLQPKWCSPQKRQGWNMTKNLSATDDTPGLHFRFQYFLTQLRKVPRRSRNVVAEMDLAIIWAEAEHRGLNIYTLFHLNFWCPKQEASARETQDVDTRRCW